MTPKIFNLSCGSKKEPSIDKEMGLALCKYIKSFRFLENHQWICIKYYDKSIIQPALQKYQANSAIFNSQVSTGPVVKLNNKSATDIHWVTDWNFARKLPYWCYV